MRSFCFIVALTVLLCPVAAADSWIAAAREVYFSSNGRVRLTVTPRSIESPLEYFEGLVAEEQVPGQTDESTSARGLLERRDHRGRWTVVWDKPLLNDVAPVSALTLDSGRYTVTFDDWHFVGTGQHVVVIYDEGGDVVRSLSLADLLPDFYIEALPRSVSSIHWGDEHRISGDTLVLRVIVPSEQTVTRRASYVDLRVDLSSGRLVISDDPSWRRALHQAQVVANTLRAERAEARAAFEAPLLVPPTDGERDWHMYLTEAFFRLDPEWDNGYPRAQVLRSPARSDYAASRDWLCDTLQDEQPAQVVMIASPAAPDNLLRVLGECVRTDALRQARVYIVVPQELHERAVAALMPTGAQVIWIDPTAPIPQRRERLDSRN